MIISRTVTVPLSSLSRKAKMDSMASFSPRAARDPVASASSSAAARLGGKRSRTIPKTFRCQRRPEASGQTHASESAAPDCRASLCAFFTTRFMIPFANALTSNTSAI